MDNKLIVQSINRQISKRLSEFGLVRNDVVQWRRSLEPPNRIKAKLGDGSGIFIFIEGDPEIEMLQKLVLKEEK